MSFFSNIFKEKVSTFEFGKKAHELVDLVLDAYFDDSFCLLADPSETGNDELVQGMLDQAFLTGHITDIQNSKTNSLRHLAFNIDERCTYLFSMVLITEQFLQRALPKIEHDKATELIKAREEIERLAQQVRNFRNGKVVFLRDIK